MCQFSGSFRPPDSTHVFEKKSNPSDCAMAINVGTLCMPGGDLIDESAVVVWCFNHTVAFESCVGT